jgi:hypothetical protein
MLTKLLTPQLLRPLVLEHLARQPTGQVHSVVSGVVELTIQKKLFVPPYGYSPERYEREELFDRVQMIMWQFLPQGILVWGLGGDMNDEYPFYRLTEHGKDAVKNEASRPQPYDPDGFMKAFKRLVPNADLVVLDYLEEAVQAFNHACYKSAAVMLGAASEMLTILLCDKFEQKITDTGEQKKFAKDCEGISILKKFAALQDRLERMVKAKKFKDQNDLREAIGYELPSVSNIIRRSRNEAGHPAIPKQTEPDDVLAVLRLFPRHARNVYDLLNYFENNPAEW